MFTTPTIPSACTGSGVHPAILFLRLACSGHNALSWPEDRFASFRVKKPLDSSTLKTSFADGGK
jgi:hypothetical protein